jgi:glutathione peroxidase-family protein
MSFFDIPVPSLEGEPDLLGPLRGKVAKFLIGRDGEVLKRYPPPTDPRDNGLLQDIADALD